MREGVRDFNFPALLRQLRKFFFQYFPALKKLGFSLKIKDDHILVGDKSYNKDEIVALLEEDVDRVTKEIEQHNFCQFVNPAPIYNPT